MYPKHDNHLNSKGQLLCLNKSVNCGTFTVGVFCCKSNFVLLWLSIESMWLCALLCLWEVRETFRMVKNSPSHDNVPIVGPLRKSTESTRHTFGKNCPLQYLYRWLAMRRPYKAMCIFLITSLLILNTRWLMWCRVHSVQHTHWWRELNRGLWRTNTNKERKRLSI